MTHLKNIVLLAVSAFIISPAASASLVKKTIPYKDGSAQLEGYLVYDDASKVPRAGILMTPDWMGLTEKAKLRANQYAELGYVVFAVDVYGKGIRPKNNKEAGALAGKYKGDRPVLRRRMEAALDTFIATQTASPQDIAAIGYCFGGTSAIELARSGANLKAVVTFHAGLDSPHPEDGKNIKAQMLILHGADDPLSSPQDVAAFEEELRKAKVNWQMVQYGGAVHSFTDKDAGSDNSKGVAYNAEADKRSWVAMKNFLNETL